MDGLFWVVMGLFVILSVLLVVAIWQADRADRRYNGLLSQYFRDTGKAFKSKGRN